MELVDLDILPESVPRAENSLMGPGQKVAIGNPGLALEARNSSLQTEPEDLSNLTGPERGPEEIGSLVLAPAA